MKSSKKRIFAIGDIHGCAKTLTHLLFNVLHITIDDLIYFLGDYIDRGPDSKGVIDTILALQRNAYSVKCVRGNHEDLFIESDNSPSAFAIFIQNGGKTTLKSFKISSYKELPHNYMQFFESTKSHFIEKNFILTHAGLDFERNDIFVNTEAMMWSRGFDRHQPKLGNRYLIHGHTPMLLETIVQQNQNCINIDAGCVFNGKNNIKGYLVALDLINAKYHSVERLD